MKKAIVLLICVMASTCVAQTIKEDPPFEETLFGSAMRIDSSKTLPREIFTAKEHQAGFTSFSGVTNIQIVAGKLIFTLASETAVLGWGNYEGKWPECRIKKYPEIFSVNLIGRQSETSSWTVAYKDPMLQNRKPIAGKAMKTGSVLMAFAYLEATGRPSRYNPEVLLLAGAASTGSCEFKVKGKPGTVIEIDSVEIVTPLHNVFARHEFTLPQGKIWRALAEVSGTTRSSSSTNYVQQVYVNGHLVELPAPQIYYINAYTIDLAPYLKPGANLVAINIKQMEYIPDVFFQSRIVMESGEMIEVASGPGWHLASGEEAGWNKAGFDASSWNVVTQKTTLARSQIRCAHNSHDFFLPEHHGRLVVANPLSRDLFYSEKAPVLLDARLPSGMQKEAPQVAYAVGRSHQGVVETVKEGVLTESRLEGNSLVYRADLGRLTGGVYVVAFALKDRLGKILETCPREPFVVVPTTPGRQVAGKSYEEDFDLELEDTIDFTDPKDPHPNFETCPVAGEIKTPVIVNKPGLCYREVSGWSRTAGFSYRIEFKHPGSFYLMELEYPDDAKRIIEAMINSKRTGVWNNVQSSAGAETGGRHLPTGQMQKLQWLHVAEPGVHSVDLVNIRNYEKVAARGLKIYRVKGRLPELASGSNRTFGQYTENIKSFGGVGKVFGVGLIGPPDNSDDYQKELKLPLMAWHINHLEWWFDTFDRYMQYNKFCGRNLLLMGVYQYTADQTPFFRVPEYLTWRVNQCPRRMLAQFMDKNNMSFYASLECDTPPPPLRPDVSDAEMEAGVETQHMVNKEGKQREVYNWLHPDIKANYERLMDDLTAVFGDLPNYRGVHTALNPRGEIWTIPGFASCAKGKSCKSPDWGWNPLYSSYDDITFRLFEQETGVKTGIAFNDVNRFRKRAALIDENAALRDQFLAWRGKKMTAFFADMAGRLRARRNDLDLALLTPPIIEFEEGKFFECLMEQNVALEDYLKTAGINVESLDAVPGIFVGRWATAHYRSDHCIYNATQDPYLWLGQTRPEYTALFNRYSPDRRYVLLNADWDESYFYGPTGTQSSPFSRLVGDSDWIMTRQLVRCHSQFGGFNAREPIIQALIVSDPNMIGHGLSDLALPIGHEQELRSIVRIISHLPKELFEPVLNTALDTNLAIRRLKRGNETWFYVANPCQWPVKGSLTIATEGKLVSEPDGKELGRGAMTLPVDLEPFGLMAFRSDLADCQISAYRTKPLDKEWIGRIENVIGAIRTFIKDNSNQFSDMKKSALEKQLQAIEADLAKGEYALAWSKLTAPEIWMYYIYEPSCKAKNYKTLLRNYLTDILTDNKAVLPAEFKKEQPSDAKPRVLTVKKASGAIKIDGVLSEQDWQNSVFSSDFRDWERQTNALVETGVAALYDDNALYLALVCVDPDTTRLEAKASGERNLWSSGDDALGIFLYPKDKNCYYQFGLNSKRTRFDQKVIIGVKTLYEEYKPEWEFASKPYGKYWIAEVMIPWKAMDLDKPPEPLNANFFRAVRYRAVDGGLWSPASSPHDYGNFGRLKFDNN